MIVKRLVFLLQTLILAGLLGCQQQEDASPTLAPTAVLSADGATSDEAASGDGATMGGEETAVATATPAPPTPTPLPPKSLQVCVSGLPQTTYLYGDNSAAAELVRQLIYDELITSLDYGYQPYGLQSLPTLENGEAQLVTVSVQTGDRIVNATGDPVTLASGQQIRLADGSLLTYDGAGAVEMLQLRATHTLQPLVWSDGTPVTATDSVFSFNMAADPNTPADQTVTARTASYTAVDDQTVEWVGLPGYVNRTYFLNVWTPLPAHQLANLTPVEMLTAAETAVSPLSYGPFVVAEQTETSLTLTRNPHYYRDGQPLIDELTLLVETNGLDGVLNGRCDIALPETIALERVPEMLTAVEAGDVGRTDRLGLAFEHIDFGINPVQEYADTRPDWFEEPTVRYAITHCIDRQGMIDTLLNGQGQLYNAYVPDEHPLFPETAVRYPYDPALGNQLLDQAGLLDNDGDGVREFIDEDGITTPFTITIGTDDTTPIHRDMNLQVQSDLQACGIAVTTYELPIIDWFADGPFSPLFGRRFDLGTFAWLNRIEPPCNLYLSRNITGPEEAGFGGWRNVNVSGWSDAAYDEACGSGFSAYFGSEAYLIGHEAALQRFTEALPMIPLFSRLETAVYAPNVTGFALDSTERHPL